MLSMHSVVSNKDTFLLTSGIKPFQFNFIIVSVLINYFNSAFIFSYGLRNVKKYIYTWKN